MRARTLQDGEEAAAGELMLTALDGPVHGIRLAFQPDKHKLCGGTGKVVADTTLNATKKEVLKAGSVCPCVHKGADVFFHGATFEIDYRTPQERLAAQVTQTETWLAGIKAKWQQEIDHRQVEIRAARESGAKAAAELEDTEPLLAEAQERVVEARQQVASARTNLRDAEANERTAQGIAERVQQQRQDAIRIQRSAESTVEALTAQIKRLEPRWTTKITAGETTLAELKAKLVQG